jgi:hypothetical protein
MPKGKGTYGTKKGRPPKKKQQMPSHVGLVAKLKARKKKIEEATKKK